MGWGVDVGDPDGLDDAAIDGEPSAAEKDQLKAAKKAAKAIVAGMRTPRGKRARLHVTIAGHASGRSALGEDDLPGDTVTVTVTALELPEPEPDDVGGALDD